MIFCMAVEGSRSSKAPRVFPCGHTLQHRLNTCLNSYTTKAHISFERRYLKTSSEGDDMGWF